MQANKNLPKLIQDAIDKGATTVEEIHKSIADLPLKMLEESDLLRGAAKQAKRVQDHTIGAIYDVIREVNQQVGTLASELLAEAADRRSARTREVHKPRLVATGKVHKPPSAAHARKVHKPRSAARAGKR